ncbi:hypothetical protein EJB05_01184, partial [Eragrostis curvula]
MTQPPPAKRLKVAVPVGVGGGAREAVSPRCRRLRQTLLVVLFMFQRYVEQFQKYHQMISSKLETVETKLEMVENKLETVQGQVEGLRHETRQMARTCPNRHADQHNRVEPAQEHDTANVSNANIRLCFLNRCLKPPVYTDKDITDENNSAIKVAVFEGGEKITTGPLLKAQIEILVLHGGFYNKCLDNWTEEEFDRHIVQGRAEQALVLGTAWLNNGEAELSHIRFKEGSSRKKFVMAARVCKTEQIAGRILEAIMEPVEVKDRRNEQNEKRHPPRLGDELYRLEKIAKDGPYFTRLLESGILTVQGLLKAFNKDPVKLRKILNMENKNSSWSKLIGHAQKCVLEDRPELKRYQSEDGKVVLFFNCVHDVVGAAFPRDYVALKGFNSFQKTLVKKYKEHAYESLEGIPSDHVMKGIFPERISSGTDAAAGPSVPAVGTSSQPVSSHEHLAADRGTGAAENCPHSEMNLVTGPIHTNANYVPMNTHEQGQGTASLGQQQIVPPSTETDWQQNFHGPIHSPDQIDQVMTHK